ncbi:MAG: C-type lectin domain-containing protein, partial [Proteobacteria bacterium]
MKNKVQNMLVFLAVLGALPLAGNAQPHESHPWIQNPANGHFYRLLPAADWKTSEHWARSLGGHLASISDKNEQDWVFNTFTKDDPQRLLWIGLHRSTPTGHFAWSDGSPLEYANWFPGEPNNTDNAE